MANTKREKLFAEFPPIPTEKWEEAITVDLKGADYERKLVWRTDEGFNVRPYYRAENLEGLQFLGSQAGEFPFVRGTRKNNRWKIHQTISVDDPQKANEEALHLLNTGVDSLGLHLLKELSDADLEVLLKDIQIPAIDIAFCGEMQEKFVDQVLALVAKKGINKEDVHIAFLFDPMVDTLSRTGCAKCLEEQLDMLASIIRKTQEYKHVRVVNITAQRFGNAGSTIVEELAFALSAGNDYIARLTDRGLSATLIARKMRFSFSVTSNYFMEIAKFRAARMLWAVVVKEYKPEKVCPCKMMVHGVTSRWNQTVYDPYVNMLRGTTEAMSSAIAGVYSLEVTPFNTSYEAPDEFSKRIARNVELLLKHEAHFDQVVDPAGGSYFVENLTQSIATEAWKLFLELEEKGGYTEAYNSGYIKQRVESSAAAKDKKIATRRQTLLGANQFPNFTEVAPKEIHEEVVTRQTNEGNVLTPYRGAMAFEQMRLGVDRLGKELKAFMLTCGNLGMARARAQFSCNFFACAGIRVQDNTYFSSIEEGVKAALESKAQIVVVCASDDDYLEAAPKVKELLQGKAILVVAGAPQCAPELEAQGISNFINVKSNVLETLKFYLKEMGI